MQLFIKNMVCPRCIAAVETTLKEMGMSPLYVRLGEARLEPRPPQPSWPSWTTAERQGFELLDDTRSRQIDQIKTLIIERIHYPPDDQTNKRTRSLSDHLSSRLHREYSQLSKLFSETEGITIEQ